MVRGRSMAVTRTAGTYQWAETASTARGRGSEAPRARQARVYALSCRAFIGFPWPKKSAGCILFPDYLDKDALGPPAVELPVEHLPIARVPDPRPSVTGGGYHRLATARRLAHGSDKGLDCRRPSRPLPRLAIE